MCMWRGSKMFHGPGSGMDNYRANYQAKFGRPYSGSFDIINSMGVMFGAKHYDKIVKPKLAAQEAQTGQIAPAKPAAQTGAELYGTAPAKTGSIV